MRTCGLGLETVSRRTNVSSRSRLGQNAQRLGLGTVRLGSRIGLGVSSRVSDHFVSWRRFVQAPAVDSFSSPITTSTPCVSELQSASELLAVN